MNTDTRPRSGAGTAYPFGGGAAPASVGGTGGAGGNAGAPGFGVEDVHSRR